VTNEELEYVCGDGARRLVQASAAPIRDRERRIVAGLVALSDITEERVIQQQIGQSQRLEAIGRLAGGVAHDFNNLLTVIIGAGALTLDSLALHDPARAQVEDMVHCAHRAADLTRQLLAFSRRQMIQPKVVDLNSSVVALVKMLQRILGEDVEVITALSQSLGRVLADPGQLDQIITNLAVNARDAMPRGGRLTIETANVDLDEAYAMQHADVRPGPHVMLAVSDTGVGMDRETQARVFEPFFTTKAHGHGTGLGLATVYGIVKQSGGHIWVYSEPGRGTTFKVYFPRVQGTTEHVAAPQAPAALARGSETVLLVEDEDAVRTLVRAVMSGAGYTVMECRDAEEAEFMTRSFGGPIHLLITDVVMPGRSGRELAEQLAPLRPAMRVLYMSGYTDNAIVHHGVIDSGVAFLEKPFTPQQLLRRMREVLDQD
jgi:signal transduction histidine kinase/ActR/RegA family two-component response regulator